MMRYVCWCEFFLNQVHPLDSKIKVVSFFSNIERDYTRFASFRTKNPCIFIQQQESMHLAQFIMQQESMYLAQFILQQESMYLAQFILQQESMHLAQFISQ